MNLYIALMERYYCNKLKYNISAWTLLHSYKVQKLQSQDVKMYSTGFVKDESKKNKVNFLQYLYKL